VRHPLFQRTALALLAALAGHPHAQTPTAVTTVQQVDDAVIFSGRISPRSAAEFLQLLQDPSITRLVITSQGGIVSAALDMGLAIHERQLDVEVPTACLSSCANYIFPAARRKTLGKPGAVAWHGNMAHVLYLQRTGRASWNEQQMEDARQLAKREAEFFSRIGVDGFLCWFAKLDPYKVDHYYYVSIADMERFGIPSVTMRDASPPLPDDEHLRFVRVDWDGLEQARPAVRLDR
jgi:hypothetical protein